MKNTSTLPTFVLIPLLSLILISCNNDSTNKNSLTAQQTIQKYSKDTTLKGRVSNKKGNINSGKIKVTDRKNILITSTEVDKNSHYAVTIPAATELPITLTFSATENSTKDNLISVAIFPALKNYDINDLTTLIAKKAKSLGGYTHSNMTIAADATVGVPDANKTSTGFRGDPTSQYGGWH